MVRLHFAQIDRPFAGTRTSCEIRLRARYQSPVVGRVAAAALAHGRELKAGARTRLRARAFLIELR